MTLADDAPRSIGDGIPTIEPDPPPTGNPIGDTPLEVPDTPDPPPTDPISKPPTLPAQAQAGASKACS